MTDGRDKTFYQRRAAEEREAALKGTPEARLAHREMADLYDQMVDGSRPRYGRIT